MSNNNDDDDRGAPHTDRSAEGSYTDLPKFRGFIGWVSNKGGGGTFSSVDVDIFHKDYSGEYRKPDNYCGEYLTFLLPQWYIDSSLSSSSLSSIGQAQAAQQETSSLAPELSSPDRDYRLHLRHSQHHVRCHCYPGMLVRRHLIIWLRHSSIRSCLYT
jgi:hypothetical protein